jgi:hypothetical protein
MSESNWNYRQPEQDLSYPDASFTGDTIERLRLVQVSNGCKQHPSAGKQHSDFAESDPNTFDPRSRDSCWKLEIQLGEKKWVESASGDGGRGAKEQRHTYCNHEEPADNSKNFSASMKCRDGLPIVGKIPVHNGKRTEPDHSHGKERNGR